MLAGLGGAYFTLGSTGSFEQEMTAGRGFIGLAAMIFGGWAPFGAFLAGIVFGFADALQSRLSILNIAVPSRVPADGPLHRDDHRGGGAGRPGARAGRRRASLQEGMTAAPVRGSRSSSTATRATMTRWPSCWPPPTPALELVAITTVAGNQSLDKTSLNARRVCSVAGIRDVPVGGRLSTARWPAAGSRRPRSTASRGSTGRHSASRAWPSTRGTAST